MRDIRGVITKLSPLVQSQYEENPYPRWVRTAAAGQKNTIIEYLWQMFPAMGLQSGRASGFSEILIAGCGTGQQLIEAAQSTDGRMLAVDLSLSSLGYAKRKALELGLTAIEFAQGDLLELGSLSRRFDVIECAGVLHHLADPFAGWRALIAEQGYGATPDGIRRCRQYLLSLDEKPPIVISGDFFGISSCRDLLFHVQEHQMTLADIDVFLRDNGLAFLGFELPPGILHAYRKRFPSDPAATNLNHWQAFESDNPDTFLGMYNFWIQKLR